MRRCSGESILVSKETNLYSSYSGWKEFGGVCKWIPHMIWFPISSLNSNYKFEIGVLIKCIDLPALKTGFCHALAKMLVNRWCKAILILAYVFRAINWHVRFKVGEHFDFESGNRSSSQSGSIDCNYHQSLRIGRANAPLLDKTDCKERENKKLVEDMFFPAGRRNDENVVDKIKKNLIVLRLQKLKRSIKPIRHFKNGPRNSIMSENQTGPVFQIHFALFLVRNTSFLNTT
ncbi:hypothetical protein QL285_042040 [Trifolium repens]|nr:hypothetical protein QL285_042040 [Trifolium repens]